MFFDPRLIRRSLIILALVHAVLLAPISSYAADEQPNVIFLLVDDMGYGDLGANGNPQLRTPNIDQLGRESVRFTDYHVSPRCTPTRGELLTGLSAFGNGATSVFRGRSVPRRELPFMPHFFRDAGYATAHIGKWHLGSNYPFRAHDRGFDLSIALKGFGTASIADYYLNDSFDDHYRHNGTLQQYPGYNTDVFFNESMRWMQQQTKPFFVYLATTAPHGPHYVASSYLKPYEYLPPALAAFYGVTTQLDENVGRLIKFLDDNDLSRNTILIFMSDNGTQDRTNFYNAGMRGRKGSLYEGGHRVPFFIRWPVGIPGRPRDIDTLTHSTDLLPTLIELAGLKRKRAAQFDGQSLVPLLNGQAESFADRKLVVQYGVEFEKWDSAVLWNRWRLVQGEELYDLSTDPGQETNVADSRPDIVSALRAHYESWVEATRPLMGRRNFHVVGSPAETVTTLSAAEWVGPNADMWGELEHATSPLFGHWNIEAESTGDYAVSLYLFPPEANIALNRTFRNIPAIPVAGAKLILDDREYVSETSHDATHAQFEVSLKQGEKHLIEGQFLDAAGQPLWGAVIVLVQPIRRESPGVAIVAN